MECRLPDFTISAGRLTPASIFSNATTYNRTAHMIYLILTAPRHHTTSQSGIVMLWFVIPLTVVTLMIFVYRTARAGSPQATSGSDVSQSS